MSKDVSIGTAARASGVKVPTIRYYEQIGLLPAPARSDARRRLFGPGDLRRLSFIRHARELGFDMEAIATLLVLQDDPHGSCATADAIARARLAEVERRITALEALRGELQRMVDECANGRVAECRVIETLADTNHTHGRFD
ncbi:MerR family transcriptional regulator [Pinisolibacter sp.]|uniref:MerR family transcriptional regulator n=1 Tax=Pinisolibacter sp. TaxID=2172024 RepID=UPI002FDC99F4